MLAKVRDGFYLARITSSGRDAPASQRLLSTDELMGWVFFDTSVERDDYPA